MAAYPDAGERIAVMSLGIFYTSDPETIEEWVGWPIDYCQYCGGKPVVGVTTGLEPLSICQDCVEALADRLPSVPSGEGDR